MARAPAGIKRFATLRAVASFLVALGLALAALPAAAAWPPYGAELGSTYFWFYDARVYPNLDGGASVGYFTREGGTQLYPLLETALVAGDGSTPFPLDSPGIGSSDMSSSDLSASGGGGIYLAHGYPAPASINVERRLGPPGWPASGLTLAPNGTNWASDLSCARTSDDGCLVAWIPLPDVPVSASGPLYASIARSDATVDPGWGTGLPLGSAFLVGGHETSVAADDAGGGYVAWWNYSQGPVQFELRLTRVTAHGSLAPGWSAGGLLVAGYSTIAVYPSIPPRILRLPGGDLMVLWKTGANNTAISPGVFHLQRVRPDGTLALGWPAAGVTLNPAPSTNSSTPDLLSDGGDGVLVVWADEHSIRLNRVLGSGATPPGWPGNGLALNTVGQSFTLAWSDDRRQGKDNVYNFRCCSDGLGGLFVAWPDSRGNPGPSVWVTHWTNTGIPWNGWTVAGRMVNDPAVAADLGGIAPTLDGGIFVAWSEHSFQFLQGSTAYLAKIEPEFPTPVLVSLVSAAALGGRVRLEWSLGIGVAEAAVYRSAAGGPWMRVATLAPDGRGRVAYEDGAAVPGTRYGYRLGLMEAGVEVFAGEAWVEVPRALLALEGARPNPSPGRALTAAFTLADGAPARLEALDLAGRRVATSEVGSLGAGQHLVTMARPGALPPGLYWLRLTQAGHELQRHAVVLP